jgi:hypothetical protein
MARLNLTLDPDTFAALGHAARSQKRGLATCARLLLREALARQQREAERRRWAEAYRADRADALSLVRVLEPGELELLDDEGA